MARLVLAVMILAALAAGVAAIVLGLRAAVLEGDRRVKETQMEREGLSRIAFVLLIALMIYAAFAGGTP